MLLILLRFVHFLVLQGSFKSFQYNINEELLKVTLHQMEQQFYYLTFCCPQTCLG